MKLHRFYVGNLKLEAGLTVADKSLVWQWTKVLRLQPGSQVVLFNEARSEASYGISDISKSAAVLQKLDEIKPKIVNQQIILFWSLLKRDNNELILQKCTELGVWAFAPIISDRTIKKDFNLERAQKIVVEASEQCGRGDIPKISSPAKIKQAIEEYGKPIQLLVADQNGPEATKIQTASSTGVLIGPEGGWSDEEIKLFASLKLQRLKISQLTLRAETAAIVAVSKLL